MMPDGRIIDTANGNVSHTEGQGFAMLLAVANNDRPAFDKLWQWTDNTLRNKSNGLFYWRYNPVAPDPIADKKQRLRWRYPDRLGAAARAKAVAG